MCFIVSLTFVLNGCIRWFTYVASIELLERLLGSKSKTSRRYVSLLVVCRLLPNLVLIPFGGVLADARDRRKSMIVLDAVGAIAPFFYLLASYFKSIEIIYMVTLLQASIAALYEPCRTSIIPLMVKEDEYMKKATTLAGLAWSVMAAIGAGLGGYMLGIIGVNACFIVDSISFIISGLLMYMVGGSWDVSDGELSKLTMWEQMEDMTVEGLKYIRSSTFWPLLFLKITTCLVYGGSDILNVSFAEEDSSSTEAEQSERLGALFFMTGMGCLFGPLIADPLTKMSEPKTVLNACVASFALQALGCLAMGQMRPFGGTMLSTMVRAAGSSIAWIDSQVLIQVRDDIIHRLLPLVCITCNTDLTNTRISIQRYVQPDMLGRVTAIEYGLALASEAFSATISGLLQDDFGLSARQVSSIMGVVGLCFFAMWLCYRIFGSAALLQTPHHLDTVQLSTEKDVVGEELVTEKSKLLT